MDVSGRRQGAATRKPGNLPSFFRVPGGVPRLEEQRG